MCQIAIVLIDVTKNHNECDFFLISPKGHAIFDLKIPKTFKTFWVLLKLLCVLQNDKT